MQPMHALTQPTRRPTAKPRAALVCALLLALAALLTACGDDEQGPLEISGSYTDEFNLPHEITQTSWDQTNGGFILFFTILEYSNAQDRLVAHNDSANSFNPDLFSRFSWTRFNGDLYFCQNPFDALSAEDALAAPEPDRTDPSVDGCGGFFWTNLTP